jgi:hypothetical protein
MEAMMRALSTWCGWGDYLFWGSQDVVIRVPKSQIILARVHRKPFLLKGESERVAPTPVRIDRIIQALFCFCQISSSTSQAPQAIYLFTAPHTPNKRTALKRQNIFPREWHCLDSDPVGCLDFSDYPNGFILRVNR